MALFQSPNGTKDWLAPESEHLAYLVESFRNQAELANYHLLLSPMFEELGVFVRGVGDASEIITKEMYEFTDKGGRNLALRPEGTASVMRAFLQHNPPSPFKVWYAAPSFRYERPQAGRYRQHHQVGLEAIGVDDPNLDFEIITLLTNWFHLIGLRQLSLKINSLGDDICRPAYLQSLTSYLEKNQSDLCREHQERWQVNPLRVLDCKKLECVGVKENAPKIKDHLCSDCNTHFATLLSALDDHGIDYVLDDYLVRGLDYYTRTTFEVACLSLESAQNAIGGGGRYDNLAKSLGGKDTPGIGFASGLERVLLACQSQGISFGEQQGPSVFVIDLLNGKEARDITLVLRDFGISCERSFGSRSLKSQLRQADKSGAKLALIIGEQEKENDLVQLKWLSDHKKERFSEFLTTVTDGVYDISGGNTSFPPEFFSTENKARIVQYHLSDTLPAKIAIWVIKEFLNDK